MPRFVAKQPAVQILAASAETPDRPYLAFPAILDLGGDVLISFKHGRAHAGDAGATLDWIRFDKECNRKLSQSTLAEVKGEIMQMGDWVRFPNGDIANYVDAHKTGVLRSGLCVVRSEDGGRTFGPVQRLELVDGVEYGYAFDAISRNRSTWMLVMTFANLPGGKLVYKYSSQPGSVDVIRSDGTRPIHVQPRHARHLASCRPGHRDGPIARGQLLRPTVLAGARRPDPFLHHHLQAWCRSRSGHRAARVQVGGGSPNGTPWLRKGTRFMKPILTRLTAVRSRIDRIAITSPPVVAGLPIQRPGLTAGLENLGRPAVRGFGPLQRPAPPRPMPPACRWEPLARRYSPAHNAAWAPWPSSESARGEFDLSAQWLHLSAQRRLARMGQEASAKTPSG